MPSVRLGPQINWGYVYDYESCASIISFILFLVFTNNKNHESNKSIIWKVLTLDEAFQYSITSVPLSIAILNGDLHQSEKASLRNFLINNSNATTN